MFRPPHLLPALCLAALAVGCATGERPRLVPGATIPPATAPQALDPDDSTTTTATPADEPTLVSAIPEVPVSGTARAVVTPTGVVVEVLDDLGDGFEIRTPCGNEAELTWGTPIYGAHVLIDPGHGGDVETGAVGLDGTVESELNLEVARALAAELRGRGFTVVLSRQGEYRVPIITRAQLADALDVDAVISLHHNAPNTSPSEKPGTEIYVQEDRPQSRRLGGLIYAEVVTALGRYEASWVAASDAGVLSVVNTDGEDAYGIVRRPVGLSVLVEFGYLSNQTEEAVFNEPTYAGDMAVAVADGVERWFLTDDGGAGFVDVPRVFNPGGGTGGTVGCEDPELE